jgi:transposase
MTRRTSSRCATGSRPPGRGWARAVLVGARVLDHDRLGVGGVGVEPEREAAVAPANGLQAPPPLRRQRDPARDRADRRQPQRRHPALAAGRLGRPGPRQGRPPAQTARAPARRPRLRPRQVPPRAPEAWRPAGDRAAPDRARLALGRERWVVERTFAWLHNFRRLRVRWERDPALHLAFMQLAAR